MAYTFISSFLPCCPLSPAATEPRERKQGTPKTKQKIDRISRSIFSILIVQFILRQQHFFNKNGIPAGGIVNKDMGHRTDELAVLQDGGAAHQCVNIGPTRYRFLILS